MIDKSLLKEFISYMTGSNIPLDAYCVLHVDGPKTETDQRGENQGTQSRSVIEILRI